MNKFNLRPDETIQTITAGQVLFRAVELAGSCAMLVLAVYLFTGQYGFHGWVVHPYWLPVLVFAAHYGFFGECFLP